MNQKHAAEVEAILHKAEEYAPPPVAVAPGSDAGASAPPWAQSGLSLAQMQAIVAQKKLDLARQGIDRPSIHLLNVFVAHEVSTLLGRPAEEIAYRRKVALTLLDAEKPQHLRSWFGGVLGGIL
jgi:hypothetical protein